MLKTNEATLTCSIFISDIAEEAVCFIHKHQTMDVCFNILKTRREPSLGAFSNEAKRLYSVLYSFRTSQRRPRA